MSRAGLAVLAAILLAAILLARGAVAGDLGTIRSLVRSAHYAEAESLARARLAETERNRGPESLAAAEALDVLVEALWKNPQASDSTMIALAEREVRIKERTLGHDHPALARSLTRLGRLYWARGDLHAAQAFFERSVTIQDKAAPGADDPGLARSISFLASMYFANGRYAEARPHAERALRLLDATPDADPEDLIRALGTVANLRTVDADYAGAQALWERAMRLGEEQRADDSLVLWATNELGRVEFFAGDWAQARLRFERVLAARERQGSAGEFYVADVLDNLAGLLRLSGDYSEARRRYERSLAIMEKTRGPVSGEVARVCNNLANLLYDTGDYDGARQLYERALDVGEKAWGPDYRELVTFLNNLAELERRTGDPAGAEQLLTRSLAIGETSLGPDHPDVAAALQRRGELSLDTGDAQGGRALLERAVAIQDKALGPDHPRLADTLTDLAAALAATGETRAALGTALRAESISRDHLRRTARTLPERQALRYGAARTSGLSLALSLTAGSGADSGSDPETSRRTWDALIRSRALVLDEMATRHRALWSGGPSETSRLAGSYLAAQQRLASLVVQGPAGNPVERYRATLAAAREEQEAAEQALLERSAAFRQELARSRAGIDEVVAALPPGNALVSYARYDRQGERREPASPSYVAFVLASPEGAPHLVPLGTAPGIDSLVARWRAEVGRPLAANGAAAQEAACRAAGDALRRAIWDPIASHLSGAARVFVVPDGALDLVSFEALPLADSRYLVDLGPAIHYLSAERDLVPAGGPEPAGRGLLALGDPDYDGVPGAPAPAAVFRGAHSQCAEFARLRFARLPGTAREVEETVKLWGERESIRLTGPRATEAAFKARAPGRRILHLATHGFFLGEGCTPASGGTRGVGGVVDAEPAGTAPESPLILSGLALAGANRREAARPDGDDDGILTAEEVAALDLRGVEWAVVSACDTGVGEVQAGEGVLGLRRAFQVAGARTLVLSLWPVDDEAARAWMRALYTARLQRRLPTAEAVREASLAVLAARRQAGASTHPFAWAGFVAAGDWR